MSSTLLDCSLSVTTTSAATQCDKIEAIEKKDDERGSGLLSSVITLQFQWRQAQQHDATSGERRRQEGEGRQHRAMVETETAIWGK